MGMLLKQTPVFAECDSKLLRPRENYETHLRLHFIPPFFFFFWSNNMLLLPKKEQTETGKNASDAETFRPNKRSMSGIKFLN